MFFILRQRTKDTISFGVRVLVTVVILGLIVSHLYGIYNGYVFTSQGLLREDKPSGNPMRVEKAENPFDQFVVKIKDFYQKD